VHLEAKDGRALNQPPRSFLAQVFLSPDEPRLRAGWRLLLQSILLLIILSVVSLGVVIVAAIVGYDVANLQPLSLIDLVPTAIAMTLSVWIARRLLDRRSFASLGFRLDRHALPDVLAGALIPGVVMGLIYAVEVGAGWLRFDGWAWETIPASQVAVGLTGGLLGFIVVGYQEELLSRGYHLQNIRDGMGLRWALLLSSVIFALMHLGNPNSTWYSTLLGLTAAGYFLAYGWVRTRQLWLPIGLHVGWNFFEGSVFGFPVSGLDLVGLIRQTPTGPVAITGGPFGPEAGLIILPAMAIGVALIWLYTRRRLASPAS
jgi:membrane protease YdiL (CAAX protease family)